jgi:hypothetical protein
MDVKKEITVAFISAAVGSIITLIVTGWTESRDRLNEARFQSLISESKEQTLALVKEQMLAAAEQKKEFEILLNTSEPRIVEVTKYAETAKQIVKGLESKSNISDEDLKRIFAPTIQSEIQQQVKNRPAVALSNCSWYPITTHQSFQCPDRKIATGVCLTNKGQGCPGGTATGEDSTWVTAGGIMCCDAK